MSCVSKIVEKKLKRIPRVGPYSKHYKKDLDNFDLDLSGNLNRYLDDDSNYPDFWSTALKNVYIKYLIEDQKLKFLENNIGKEYDLFFTSSAIIALDVVLKSYCSPNDTISAFTPNFSAYRDWANILNLNFIPLYLYGNNYTQFDLKEIKKIKPNVIVVCDPNNPIGSKIDDTLVQQMVSDMQDTLFIFDEAYLEFSDFTSNAKYLEKHKNIIIIKTFSKVWGMANLRLCAIIAEPNIIDLLLRVNVPYSISSHSSYKAVYKINFEKDKVFNSWKKIKEARMKIFSALNNNTKVIKVYDSQTNFICFQVRDIDLFEEALELHKIKLYSASRLVKDCFRVSIGNDYENKKFTRFMESF